MRLGPVQLRPDLEGSGYAYMYILSEITCFDDLQLRPDGAGNVHVDVE